MYRHSPTLLAWFSVSTLALSVGCGDDEGGSTSSGGSGTTDTTGSGTGTGGDDGSSSDDGGTSETGGTSSGSGGTTSPSGSGTMTPTGSGTMTPTATGGTTGDTGVTTTGVTTGATTGDTGVTTTGVTTTGDTGVTTTGDTGGTTTGDTGGTTTDTGATTTGSIDIGHCEAQCDDPDGSICVDAQITNNSCAPGYTPWATCNYREPWPANGCEGWCEQPADADDHDCAEGISDTPPYGEDLCGDYTAYPTCTYIPAPGAETCEVACPELPADQYGCDYGEWDMGDVSDACGSGWDPDPSCTYVPPPDTPGNCYGVADTCADPVGGACLNEPTAGFDGCNPGYTATPFCDYQEPPPEYGCDPVNCGAPVGGSCDGVVGTGVPSDPGEYGCNGWTMEVTCTYVPPASPGTCQSAPGSCPDPVSPGASCDQQGSGNDFCSYGWDATVNCYYVAPTDPAGTCTGYGDCEYNAYGYGGDYPYGSCAFVGDGVEWNYCGDGWAAVPQCAQQPTGPGWTNSTCNSYGTCECEEQGFCDEYACVCTGGDTVGDCEATACDCVDPPDDCLVDCACLGAPVGSCTESCTCDGGEEVGTCQTACDCFGNPPGYCDVAAGADDHCICVP